MKITYINHSGFLIETRDCYYIFDYYKGELPHLDKEKEVIVFCSHFHEDIKKFANQPAGTASQTNSIQKRGAKIKATDRRIARFTMFAIRNGRMIPRPRRTPSVAILIPIKMKK